MKKSEREAWRQYYIRIRQWGRWRDFRGMSSSLVHNMERRVRGLTNVEDEPSINEVIRVAKALNELVDKYASEYCEEKPEKPLGRPYGSDL